MPSLFVVSVVLAFCAACQKEAAPSHEPVVVFNFAPQPPRVGPMTVAFAIVSANGKLAVGAHVTVEADMSHPGMGPVFAEAKEADPGRYQSTLELGMAGDWVILLHASLRDGEKLERQFDLKGVRP